MEQRVFITVGEVSGDRHAAELIRSLKALRPGIRIEALGGPRMREAGAVLLAEMTGKAAMLHHGAARAIEVWRLLRDLRKRYRADPPDLHVCVDSSGMNLHFARAAKSCGVPVLYYVAPQVWASRQGRIKRIARDVDQLACILPFEQDYFHLHGIHATFVGHPLFDELPAAAMRDPARRFPHAPPVIGLLPGSRRGEAAANFSRQIEVARAIQESYPDARFMVPTTAATHPVVEEALREPARSALAPAVCARIDAFDDLVPACDLCLTVSGTATLHVAAHRVPMIVVYHVSPAAWHLAGRWMLKTRSIALVNLLAGTIDPSDRLVPEFFPWYGSTRPAAELALAMLRDPERLEAQRRGLDDLVRTLDRPGASDNVAKLALRMMDAPPTAP